MSSASRGRVILRDSGLHCYCSSRCLRAAPSNIQIRHISRRIARKPRPIGTDLSRQTKARLALEREKRDSLRAALIRQYEEEERPKWAKNNVRLGQSFKMDNDLEGRPRVSLKSREQQNASRIRETDVQCGIFWDIENVSNEYASDLSAVSDL